MDPTATANGPSARILSAEPVCRAVAEVAGVVCVAVIVVEWVTGLDVVERGAVERGAVECGVVEWGVVERGVVETCVAELDVPDLEVPVMDISDLDVVDVVVSEWDVEVPDFVEPVCVGLDVVDVDDSKTGAPALGLTYESECQNPKIVENNCYLKSPYLASRNRGVDRVEA